MPAPYGPYSYKKDGKPLTRCPQCGSDLSGKYGVNLELVVDGKNVSTETRLDENGVLIDTEDGAVEKGFHGSTECGHCGGQLVDMDGVEEWEGERLEHPARATETPAGPTRPTAVEDIEDLIELAKAHGEDSEPDHEVGDLQEICRMLWEWLSPEQRHLALRELREYANDTMGFEVPRK